MTDLRPWDLPNLVGEDVDISFTLKDMSTMAELPFQMGKHLDNVNYRMSVRKLDEYDCLQFIQGFGNKVAEFLKRYPDFKERFGGRLLGGTIPNAYKYPATATTMDICPEGRTHYGIGIERVLIDSYDGSYIRADIMRISNIEDRRDIRKRLGLSPRSWYVDLY